MLSIENILIAALVLLMVILWFGGMANTDNHDRWGDL